VKLAEDSSVRERIDMTTLLILSGKGIFRGEACSEAGVNIVGIGPGDPGHVTREAKNILQRSAKIFGAERYLKLVGDISPGEKVAHSGPCPERMAARFLEAKNVALNGEKASVLTGGDPSVFSSGWRIMDQARGSTGVHISPGVSAFSSAAAKAGAPLVNDFVLLSEAQDPSGISAMVEAGFGIVIYNVKGHEIASLLQDVDPARPCALARDVEREGEEIIILTAEDLQCAQPCGFRFTLLVASANSFIKNGRIITRRGYENKYSY
jgi:precorrin-3B C17-methyltransferase